MVVNPDLGLADRSIPGNRPGSGSAKQISGNPGSLGVLSEENSAEYSKPATINASETIIVPHPLKILKCAVDDKFLVNESRHASVRLDSKSSNNQVSPSKVNVKLVFIMAPEIRLKIRSSNDAFPE